MSLLREAERYVANQRSYAGLNALITTMRQPGRWQGQAKDADSRREQGKQKSQVDGRLISFKDNICTRDLPTTCASTILETFTSPFDATVVQQLQDAGAIVAGKTNLDEFGMGSHSIHSRFGPVRSARCDCDLHLSAGGSSGGSAVAVATDQCYAALGTDTGGSVRLPAAYTGVVGFKPSYGLISRWGVVAYANSLDTVGILAKDTAAVCDVFDILNQHDPRDPTSLSPLSRSRISSQLETPPFASRMKSSPLKIGVPAEYNISELTTSVRRAWYRSLEYMRQQGHIIQPVSLPMTKLALSAYYILAPAEASSNLAKYDGVRYGTHVEGTEADTDTPQSERYLYARTRGQGFGTEVKRRILLGAFSLSADAIDNYFIQAQRIRRLVQQDFNTVFRTAHPLADQEHAERAPSASSVDVLICPTAPSPPPRITELVDTTLTSSPLDAYVNDVFTVPASLAGLPAISIPVSGRGGNENSGSDDLAGVQIVGQFGDDELVLKVGGLLEGI